ncbi:methyltransferase domain-containing protein [Actinomadura sp. KC06]|uniref:methyltransferase domain-containing protein n=1 Tax=Actinomadura sp. KC06 TaxID=2530369 RepID=UPI001404B29D|nr:methyltransferase domain-containing protein [Actinomadura sp. KC06]
MARPGFDPVEIGKTYDENAAIRDGFGYGHLHMWYWYDDEDEAPLEEAVHRITRKVVDTLGVRPGEHVLDAGCGQGEPARYLAREFGARVTGVSVSAAEIDDAIRRTKGTDLADRVRFEYGDYTDLPYPDGTFDAVLVIEALMYSPDLDRALRELFRVLRPGGRISFSDFSLMPTADPKRIEKFMSTVKMNVLPSLPEWLDRVQDAGFGVEEHTQCGPRVYGKKSKYLKAAMARRDEISTAVGDSTMSEFSRSLQGFYAPRKDDIGYVIISARKP